MARSYVMHKASHSKHYISQIGQYLHIADLIIEVIDSRIPFTGKICNEVDAFRGKHRCLVFSKRDLMDTYEIQKWKTFYSQKSLKTIFVSLKDNISVKRMIAFLSSPSFRKRESIAVVVGLPNSGKSTFINLMKKKHSAPVGNRPGITRGIQWLRINESLLLLDTPGIIRPSKIHDTEMTFKLFAVNSIDVKENDLQEYTLRLVDFMKERYPEALYKRYDMSEKFLEEESSLEILKEIGKRRGLLSKKDTVDLHNTSMFFRDEVCSGRLGKIVLESVSDITNKERRDKSS
ncbi:MAG: 50S ribosome-binding GTPase [Thermotogae bacterium]|nr:50S ribosome-binding GTPase [Thermotogota bacterium]